MAVKLANLQKNQKHDFTTFTTKSSILYKEVLEIVKEASDITHSINFIH